MTTTTLTRDDDVDDVTTEDTYDTEEEAITAEYVTARDLAYGYVLTASERDDLDMALDAAIDAGLY